MYLRDTTLADDCAVLAVELLTDLGVERFVPKGAGMLDRVLHYCRVQQTIRSMTLCTTPPSSPLYVAADPD